MAEVKKSQKQALENKIHAYEEKITKEEENRRQWHSTVKWQKPKPGDVTSGENAVIGGGAVVTKDIPDNTIAAGVPAKVIRVIA